MECWGCGKEARMIWKKATEKVGMCDDCAACGAEGLMYFDDLVEIVDAKTGNVEWSKEWSGCFWCLHCEKAIHEPKKVGDKYTD